MAYAHVLSGNIEFTGVESGSANNTSVDAGSNTSKGIIVSARLYTNGGGGAPIDVQCSYAGVPLTRFEHYDEGGSLRYACFHGIGIASNANNLQFTWTPAAASTCSITGCYTVVSGVGSVRGTAMRYNGGASVLTPWGEISSATGDKAYAQFFWESPTATCIEDTGVTASQVDHFDQQVGTGNAHYWVVSADGAATVRFEGDSSGNVVERAAMVSFTPASSGSAAASILQQLMGA